MKTVTVFITAIALLFTHLTSQAQRYLAPVFDEVEVQADLAYAANYTIITIPVTGHSAWQELKMDVYLPIGDTATERPLLLFFHQGNFLPIQINTLTTGTRTDSFAVEICTRLARMGYVAASVSYRLGWNPALPDATELKAQLLQAIYRGVQDSRSCIRFFRKTVEEEGNPFGICPDRITLMGKGTGGGFIALASGTLDTYSDLLIPKFIGPDINGDGKPDPMIIEDIHGDLNGENILGTHPFTGDTLALPNHPGYPSEAQLCVNLGGALADSSWLDAGDPPFISFHVPNDPFSPYMDGYLLNHPGNPFFEVHGSYRVAQQMNLMGNNQMFQDANIQDGFTTAANTHNDGYEGLFPFHRPGWVNPLNGNAEHESTPWSWWDADYWSQIEHPYCQSIGLPLPDCNFHFINWINDQDMSAEKGRTYTDSIIGYFAPRAFAALNLGGTCFTKTKEKATERRPEVTVSPNPAKGLVTITSRLGHPILGIGLYDLSGQLVKKVERPHDPAYTLELEGLGGGLYIVKVQFREGVFSKKVILQ